MIKVLNEHFDFEGFNKKLNNFLDERTLRYEKEEEEYWAEQDEK